MVQSPIHMAVHHMAVHDGSICKDGKAARRLPHIKGSRQLEEEPGYTVIIKNLYFTTCIVAVSGSVIVTSVDQESLVFNLTLPTLSLEIKR